MRRPLGWAGASLALIVALAGWLALKPSRSEPPVSAAEPPKAAHDPLEVAVNHALARQIRVGSPEWQDVSAAFSSPGRVEADETRMSRAGAPVGGRIAEIKAVEGQAVSRGQTLATLQSTELSDCQSSLIKALSQAELAGRSVARARQLLEAGVIGAAELQRREAEQAQAKADLEASRDRLHVLGASEEAIARVERTRSIHNLAQVTASIAGVILERHATAGQVVQPADTLFVIADLSQVWLVADVPEQAAGLIHTGKSLEAEIPALPGRVVHGRLSFVSATVNPETRTVRVRMDLPNPGRLLKPAMLANIRLADAAERRLVVPSTAIVREGNQDVLFVQTAPGKFLMTPVTPGGTFGDRRVIAAGLQPQATIVVDGAFHLNNERKRASLHAE